MVLSPRVLSLQMHQWHQTTSCHRYPTWRLLLLLQCVRRSRLNWAVEQLPRLLSYQARQSAKDHHLLDHGYHGQITPACNKSIPRLWRRLYSLGLSVYPGYCASCQMDQFEPEFQHLDYLICIQTDFGITSFKSLASAPYPVTVLGAKSSCRQRSEFARPQCSLQSHRQCGS